MAERAPLASHPIGVGEAPGAAWSKPRVAAKVSDTAHWNPVLFSPNPSTIVLHFKVGRSIRHWVTWSQCSLDGGRTWSPAAPLVEGDRGGRGAVKNKPIELRSGRWLAGASLERFRKWDAFIDRSENGIDGWERSDLIALDRKQPPTKGLIQPTLWQSEDGIVHAYMRSTAGRIFESVSSDDGESWSDAQPTPLPNNNSGIDLARLPDGRIALACNPVPGNWAERTPLAVLFSEDEGLHWTERIDLETAPGEYSYPAIIATEGGLRVSYSWNRRRIALALISPEDLSH